MGKISLKRRLEKYEDFYDRAFTTQNIDEILQAGGGESLETFKAETRNKTKNKDYWDVMFNRPKAKDKQKLGNEVYKRFFANEAITKNKSGRIIVRSGETIKFHEKVYKGGQFVPRSYLARRY